MTESKTLNKARKKRKQAITSEVVLITPSMAAEWLNHNVGHNRVVRRKQVQWLASQIARDRWMLTHQGIAFDHEGQLQDGQHRLSAIIEAGKPIEMMVFRGVDPDTFKVLDTGKNRTPADVLYTAGLTSYASVISYAVRMILAYRTVGGMTHKERHMISNTMVLDFAKKNYDVLEPLAAKYVKTSGTYGAIIGQSLALALHYVCGHLKDCDMETAGDFYEKVYTGADLDKYSPILFLRNWLTKERGTEFKPTFRLKYAMIIKGWNAYRSDAVITRIWTWRTEEDLPVPY